MTGSTPLSELKGVGPQLFTKLQVLGLKNVSDLVSYLPRKYDDYSKFMPIKELKPGVVTIHANIGPASGKYVRRGLHITEAIATDDTGSIRIVWFNQPYRAASLKKGILYYISGTFELSHQRFAIMNPTIELASEFPINTARIVPIYGETKGITSKQIRGLVAQTLPYISQLSETMPSWAIKKYDLCSYSDALQYLHFPKNNQTLLTARRRLGFEEVFRLVLASLLNKQENDSETSLKIAFSKELAQKFVEHLPFKLTDGQRKVAWEIFLNLEQIHPMNRLVEGDVGSGKTVIATMAALMALNQGYQTALMAPTELLARQHADTIVKLLKPLGLEGAVTLLVGGLSLNQKKIARNAIRNGQAMFLVGTQAVIQEAVDFHKLALVIIDEQHRFGVEQRKSLMAKAGHMPHVLSLTATPIPRSLALTLYGELDISVLSDKPAGRQPIITKLVSPNSRAQMYSSIKEQLNSGRQMFVVCPLISDSDTMSANSAERVYEQMRIKDFSQYKIGLLHGKLKAHEKNAVMESFVYHKIDILVSTTVIEVGVDVPNATVMIVEDAERFGLAQIHQLRGRVGRSSHQGFCYLLTSNSIAPSKRLRALESCQDGFKLAEIDLDMRGPGAIYGSLQHGQLDLRIAKLSDTKLISEARSAAQEFISRGENLLQYKHLATTIHKLRAVTNLN